MHRKHPARRAQHLVSKMRAAFDDAEVRGWEGLEGIYGLAGPDDEHVVAAAVVANAGAIVTHNVRDFPADKLPAGVHAISPAEFAANTASLDPVRARAAVAAIAARSGSKGPPLTEDLIPYTLVNTYEMRGGVEVIQQLQ